MRWNDPGRPNLKESLISPMIAAPGGFRDCSAVAVMDAQSAPASPIGMLARLRSVLGGSVGGSSEASVTKRLAGTVFIIRVVSAAMAYLSQILLARWMGGSDYGVYVYVWTWLLLLGSMMDFGISASAQKIIPEYRTAGEHALLRGFLSGSRWITFIVSTVRGNAAGGRRQAAVAVDGCKRDRSLVYRLRHAAGLRRRQHPGRHRAFARLDAARTDAAIHRAPVADHRLHRRRLRARLPSRRDACDARQCGRGVDRHDRADGGAEPPAGRPCRARPKSLRFPWMARGLAADPDGRGILPAAVLYRRAGAAAVSLLRRGRPVFRRGEDAGAGVLYSLFDGGDHRAPVCRISCQRRQGAAVGLCGACDQLDVLAVIGRDHRAAGAGQAAVVAVRTAIRRRLRHHVRCGGRPCGALRDRSGRTAAQHARPSAYLRHGLCPGLCHERGALRDAGAAIRRLWCCGRDLDLAGVRDHPVVLDRAAAPRPARARVRQTEG